MEFSLWQESPSSYFFNSLSSRPQLEKLGGRGKEKLNTCSEKMYEKFYWTTMYNYDFTSLAPWEKKIVSNKPRKDSCLFMRSRRYKFDKCDEMNLNWLNELTLFETHEHMWRWLSIAQRFNELLRKKKKNLPFNFFCLRRFSDGEKAKQIVIIRLWTIITLFCSVMKHDELMQFSLSLYFTDRRKIIVLKSQCRDLDLREAPHTHIHT